MPPSMCGGLSIGGAPSRRSRRVADRLALIRSTAGKLRCSSIGSARSARSGRARRPARGTSTAHARCPPPLDPLPVVPADRPTRERLVVLLGARRPGGPVDGDVQLVAYRHPRHQSGEQPAGPATPRRRPPAAPRWRAWRRDRAGRARRRRPARRHHVRPRAKHPRRRRVRARVGQDDDVGGEVAGDDVELPARLRRTRPTTPPPTTATDARTGSRLHRCSRSIGCHPPCCGGVHRGRATATHWRSPRPVRARPAPGGSASRAPSIAWPRRAARRLVRGSGDGRRTVASRCR